MRKKLPVVLLIAILFTVLFPFGWLGLAWPAFGAWLDGVFFNDWMHAVGHFSIFFLLSLTLLTARPDLRSRPALFFGLLLAAAVAEEFFQALYKQRLLIFDDSRDILTDIFGMAAAYVLAGQARAGQQAPVRRRLDR